QAGRVDLHGLAFEEDFAGGRGRHAEKRESQFGSPAPYQTGNAQDFSATQREGNIADMPTMIQIPDFEHCLADGCVRLWKQAVDRSPDHHRNELPFIDLADLPGANERPVAQHCHPVCQFEDFRETMADIDDAYSTVS